MCVCCVYVVCCCVLLCVALLNVLCASRMKSAFCEKYDDFCSSDSISSFMPKLSCLSSNQHIFAENTKLDQTRTTTLKIHWNVTVLLMRCTPVLCVCAVCFVCCVCVGVYCMFCMCCVYVVCMLCVCCVCVCVVRVCCVCCPDLIVSCMCVCVVYVLCMCCVCVVYVYVLCVKPKHTTHTHTLHKQHTKNYSPKNALRIQKIHKKQQHTPKHHLTIRLANVESLQCGILISSSNIISTPAGFRDSIRLKQSALSVNEISVCTIPSFSYSSCNCLKIW